MDIAIIILICVTIVVGLLNLFKKSNAIGDKKNFDEIGRKIEEENRLTKEILLSSIKTGNDAVISGVNNTNKAVVDNVKNLSDANIANIRDMKADVIKGLAEIRENVSISLKEVREDNAKQLEKMREVVDEKLTSTLNERLSQSFKVISEQLESVYKGLGEMQKLAGDVTDLKKVLSNVKTKGIWGEISLDNLLENILSREQYIKGFNIKGSGQVDFAIVLPGRNNEKVYLPMDAKFPTEDYQRLVQASEGSDLQAVAECVKKLETVIRTQAKKISEKYICPPLTTDFAIMYLPTEGLYAEVNRIPGLTTELQNKYKVVPAGPTNTTALLNSLSLGFRTLAIQKSSYDIFKIFVSFQKDFAKFIDNLEQAKEHLNKANDTLDDATKRTGLIKKRIEKVESLKCLEDAEGA
ncbi:MAG: DNA recombination protein RmuC [Christensenellales bacterium]|jgi:DNA recombination protein RmuC|nr:DNA recombination protein RmuC [Clostridiales bacterium]